MKNLIKNFTIGGRTFKLCGYSEESPVVAAFVDEEKENILLVDIEDGDTKYWNESTILEAMPGANLPNWFKGNVYKIEKDGIVIYANDDYSKNIRKMLGLNN